MCGENEKQLVFVVFFSPVIYRLSVKFYLHAVLATCLFSTWYVIHYIYIYICLTVSTYHIAHCSLPFLIQLLMGVFARVNAVSLAEDIPLNEVKWAEQNYSPKLVDDAYIMMSNNCFIAAGIYLIVLAFAGVQYYVNKRSSPPVL